MVFTNILPFSVSLLQVDHIIQINYLQFFERETLATESSLMRFNV